MIDTAMNLFSIRFRQHRALWALLPSWTYRAAPPTWPRPARPRRAPGRHATPGQVVLGNHLTHHLHHQDEQQEQGEGLRDEVA